MRRSRALRRNATVNDRRRQRGLTVIRGMTDKAAIRWVRFKRRRPGPYERYDDDLLAVLSEKGCDAYWKRRGFRWIRDRLYSAMRYRR